MNSYLRKKLKDYIKFWKKYIDIERQEEKKFHLEEIYSLGRLREKKQRAILNLKGKKLKEFDDIVLIRFGRKEPFQTDIKEGDIVLIVDKNFYKLRKNNFKIFSKEIDKYPLGTVENVGKQFLDVRVNNPLPYFIFKDEIDIHLYVNDITFRRQEEALDWMLRRKDKDWEKIVKILLDENTESLVEKINLEKNIDVDRFNNLGLYFNQYQLDFIRKSLNFKDFLLLHGPFGTGKTTTLIGSILALFEENKILVAADSNTAVDNILIRLVNLNIFNPGDIVRIGPFTKLANENIYKYSIYYLIQQHPKYKQVKQLDIEIEKIKKKQSIFQKPIPSLRRGLSDVQIHRLAASGKSYRGLKIKTLQSMSNWLLLQRQIDRLIEQKDFVKTKIISDIIENAKIVLSTNSMVFSDFIKGYFFDIAIIDEGSQATEPSTIMPIVLANKFIIAGDHKQLPPTVLSSNADPLRKSLFERLVEKIISFNFDRYQLLQIQYRMNEILMQFPNKMFYDGKLKAADEVKNISLKDKIGFKKGKFIQTDKVLYWFNIKGKQKIDNESKSYYNIDEIDLVYRIFKDLQNLGVKPEDIGIISPYSSQVVKLKNKFSDIPNLEINTIDGFQGREKEVIIISWVRTEDLGFLVDYRRFNVAITRAKRLLVNIGNIENLRKDKIFAEYEKYVKNLGVFKNC